LIDEIHAAVENWVKASFGCAKGDDSIVVRIHSESNSDSIELRGHENANLDELFMMSQLLIVEQRIAPQALEIFIFVELARPLTGDFFVLPTKQWLEVWHIDASHFLRDDVDDVCRNLLENHHYSQFLRVSNGINFSENFS
jgi:hypothetical protein